ncbi:serine hydrolase domain-containing protein [Embleya sp. NBC_00896]|uniref:serine hydrolase domain-containing protein n=1 Tax=Embleya sp. NBC_00896 TaxID=2975961 RepID=UPI002F91A4D8|nr:beta-lactamase family protein [Embleya sp. NBC_00896]
MSRPFPHRWPALASRGLAVAAVTVAGLLPVGPAQASAPSGTEAVSVSCDSGDRNCPPKRLSPKVRAELDRTIQQKMREAGIPGAIVGLWMPGKGDYVKSFGVADTATGAPMTERLNMRIGSETKTFTVTAMLELVDDGLIGLDDPISAYVAGVPDGDHITLRQLAEMRSGLFPYSADPDFVATLLADPKRPFTPEELLGYAFRHPNLFPPGQEGQYSNTNTILLGLVVEKVSGSSLADFIRTRIAKPSHLDHTFLPRGAEFPEPHAHGYTQQTPTGETADATDWNPSWGWAAGGMISDLQDLRKWAVDLATGTLLSPATQAERLKTLPTAIPTLKYGLGIFDVNGWLGHNGSLPGYQSLTVYLPAQQATLVILVNSDISYQDNELPTILAKAITGIVTPANVYDLPQPAAQSSGGIGEPRYRRLR